MKIVLDTNVLIDASEDYFRYANRILDLVISGQIEAFANRETLLENKFLAEKKITDKGYLKKLEYFFDVVKPVETKVVDQVVEDPEDNKILASAIVAGADFLITSDQHLLKLEKVSKTRIVRPNEFWSRFEEGSDSGWQKWLKDFIGG